MSEYMKALQAILLGAKVLGITEAPWLWIFLPTIYAVSLAVVKGCLEYLNGWLNWRWKSERFN